MKVFILDSLKRKSEALIHRSGLNNERGIVLPIILMMLGLIAVLGTASVVTTRTDMKISTNYKSGEEAFFIAQAGTEHARAAFAQMNEASADMTSFSDELASVAGPNVTLEGYASGTDDVPIATGTVGNGTYVVYLTNDSVDGYFNQTDSNKTLMLTSVGRGLNGSEAIVELTVESFDLFNPPGAVTLLGDNVAWTGNHSDSKELHGDDQCAVDPPGITRPVIALTKASEVAPVQAAVNGSKPYKYYTKDESDSTVTASDRPDLITAMLPASTLDYIKTNYGIDLDSASDLNSLVDLIELIADTVAPGGSSTPSVYVGTPSDPEVVVVKGDFALNGDGAGILVVTGELTYKGNVDYEGLVLVIGEGHMKRAGGGDGTINGGIIVANTLGPDGIAGTADDVISGSTLDTSGGGESNIVYCSTVINKALSIVVPRPVAFKHVV